MLIFKGEDKRFLLKIKSKIDEAVINPGNLINVKVYLTEKTLKNNLIKKYALLSEEGYDELQITNDIELSLTINRNDVINVNSIILLQVNLYVADNNYENGERCIIQKGIIGKVLQAYNEG